MSPSLVAAELAQCLVASVVYNALAMLKAT